MNSSDLEIKSLSDFENLILGKFRQDSTYPPKIEDLYSLYIYVRKTRVVSILEYGSGWSTYALSLALFENHITFSKRLTDNVRHPNPFQLMTVDSSEKFQKIALSRLDENLNSLVKPVISTSRMTLVNNQICHIFDSLTPFTADLIYIDGPGCDQVLGDVNGFTVRFPLENYKYGLPMLADPILFENFLWPGTSIITDGRGANAYFLKNNFKRNWIYSYDETLDQHIFQLKDEPWGQISRSFLEFKNAHQI